MKTWMKPLALGAVLALATAACESGTDPDGIDDDALEAAAALVAADGMFQDLNLMQSPGTWGGQAPGGPGGAPIEVEGGTSFSKTVTFFPCSGSDGGLLPSHRDLLHAHRRQPYPVGSAHLLDRRCPAATGHDRVRYVRGGRLPVLGWHIVRSR